MPAIVNPRLTSIEPRRTLMRATLAALSPTKVVSGVTVIALIGDILASRTDDAVRCNPRAVVAGAPDDKNVRIRARCLHLAQLSPCVTAECCARGAIARRKAQTSPPSGGAGVRRAGGSVFRERHRAECASFRPRAPHSAAGFARGTCFQALYDAANAARQHGTRVLRKIRGARVHRASSLRLFLLQAECKLGGEFVQFETANRLLGLECCAFHRPAPRRADLGPAFRTPRGILRAAPEASSRGLALRRGSVAN